MADNRVLGLLENDKFSRLQVDDDQVVSTLCDDIIFQILLSVPTESLVKFQYVCKTWSLMINNSVFIKTHDGKKKSETLLVKQSQNCELGGFGVLYLKSANCRYIKSSIPGYNLRPMDSLNGLVLAKTSEEKYLLVNPMTRKIIHLPETSNNCHNYQTYNLAFCEKSKTYKVVHFFRRQDDHSCEILSIGAKKWRTVDLPSAFKFQLKTCLEVQGLFFNVHDEKFSIKNMSNFNFTLYNYHRLMEIGGNLGIIFSKKDFSEDNFEIWYSDKANEIWTKKYEICSRFHYIYEPIYCSTDAKEIFFHGHSSRLERQAFAYNLVKHEWRPICTLDYEKVPVGQFIPHSNTRSWWE